MKSRAKKAQAIQGMQQVDPRNTCWIRDGNKRRLAIIVKYTIVTTGTPKNR